MLFVLLLSLFVSRVIAEYKNCSSSGHALGDNCYHIYIDMGTNVGYQIQKLYEPFKFYNNPTNTLFTKYFGNLEQRQQVCSFGFEANPLHASTLQRLETYYRTMGRRVTLFAPIAIHTTAGNITFYRDPGAAKKDHEHGASITTATLKDQKNLISVIVNTIDIGCFVRREILDRKVPFPSSSNFSHLKPRIVMKSDIEGHDSIVLTHLLNHGVLCDISLVYGEHFNLDFRNSMLNSLREASCDTQIIHMDDESGPKQNTTLKSQKPSHKKHPSQKKNPSDKLTRRNPFSKAKVMKKRKAE